MALIVQTRASKDEVLGLYQDRIKIRITAAPVDGKANQHLLRYLAQCFMVPPSRVTLMSGASSKRKKVCISRPVKIPEAFKL